MDDNNAGDLFRVRCSYSDVGVGTAAIYKPRQFISSAGTEGGVRTDWCDWEQHGVFAETARARTRYHFTRAVFCSIITCAS